MARLSRPGRLIGGGGHRWPLQRADVTLTASNMTPQPERNVGAEAAAEPVGREASCEDRWSW
jgi:hypothetical protein